MFIWQRFSATLRNENNYYNMNVNNSNIPLEIRAKRENRLPCRWKLDPFTSALNIFSLSDTIIIEHYANAGFTLQINFPESYPSQTLSNNNNINDFISPTEWQRTIKQINKSWEWPMKIQIIRIICLVALILHIILFSPLRFKND